MRWISIFIILLFLGGCGKKEIRNPISETDQPAELLKLGDQFYKNQDFENAFRAYGIVYYNYPTSQEYIDAAIGLSRSYGALKNYEKEFDLLYNLLRENLIPSKVPNVYNAIAEFYERSAGISEQLTGEGSSDYKTAIDYYKKAIDYPNSNDNEAKSFAQYKIGVLLEKLDDNQQAMQAYQNTMTVYEGSEWAAKAEQSIAALRIKLERRAEYQESGLLPTQEQKSDEVSGAGQESPPYPSFGESPTVPDTTKAEEKQPPEKKPAPAPQEDTVKPDSAAVDTSTHPTLEFK